MCRSIGGKARKTGTACRALRHYRRKSDCRTRQSHSRFGIGGHDAVSYTHLVALSVFSGACDPNVGASVDESPVSALSISPIQLLNIAAEMINKSVSNNNLLFFIIIFSFI